MVTLLTFLFLFSQQPTEVKVSDQWMRPGAKGMGTALYFVVENQSDVTDTLYKVTSDVSNMIQLHETFTKDEMMGMREVGKYVIEPGSSVELKPGGYHIMVMKLKKDIKSGDKAEFVLHFKIAGEVKITAEAKR
jgi:periplasmic copper chaperone A